MNNASNMNDPTGGPPLASSDESQCLSWTVDESVSFMIGLVGAVAVLFLWTAPIKGIWTGKESVRVTKSTRNVATAFPYVASVFNCLLWDMYCTSAPGKFLVPLFVNTAGLFLNASFTWCYLRFAEPSNRKNVQFQLGVFTVYSLAAIVLWAVLSVEIVGYMAAGVNALMLFGPLAASQQVIRSRSTQGLPFLPLVFTFRRRWCGSSTGCTCVGWQDFPLGAPRLRPRPRPHSRWRRV